MIFIGDIACPSLKVDSFISSIRSLGIFKNEIVVLNLEANILDEKENKTHNSFTFSCSFVM